MQNGNHVIPFLKATYEQTQLLNKTEMKKIILVSAAVAITVGAYAQTDSTNKKMSPPDVNNTLDNLDQNRDITNDQNQSVKNHPDGVMMQNGRMMRVKKGKVTPLDNDITMSNGTKIQRDGTWTEKNGSKMMLKEGEHIDMSGKMIHTNTYKD